MLSPDDFRAAFDDDLGTFDPRAASSLPASPDDIAWLTTVGLPRSAAPFLDFAGRSETALPFLEDVWSDAQDLPAGRYRLIGSDGAGNPICLDLAEQAAVVYLDHENRFSPTFINSSIRQLAACLLAYAELVASAQKSGGGDAFLKGNVPQELIDNFQTAAANIDPAALAPGTMWLTEIHVLRGRSSTKSAVAPQSSAKTKLPWWRRWLSR